jgi:hypothetical protein
MAITARAPESKYTPPPEGLHQAVCVDVWEPWTEESPFEEGKIVDRTRIVWLTEEVNPETERPFSIGKTYTLSLHERAKLRAHLEAWRGRAFTDEELRGFDLEKLLGVNCQIQVVHKLTKRGTPSAEIQAIVPLGKTQAKLTRPPDYIRRKDREPQKKPLAMQPGEGPPPDDDIPF